MKVVILAGGQGTRLAEETQTRPKPMVEIGSKPILWHIMNLFAAHGLREFVVALGYRGEEIKQYFLDYLRLNADLTIDMNSGAVQAHGEQRPNWTVHLVDTGQETLTGGRVRRLKPWLDSGAFIVTYGDSLADLNVQGLVDFHRAHGRLATVTAVRPPARFGALTVDGDRVATFEEKPQAGAGWINGGFLVFEPAVIDYMDGDETSLEVELLERLVADRQLYAYKHHGFWQGMDTPRDVRYLNTLWSGGFAPWAHPGNAPAG